MNVWLVWRSTPGLNGYTWLVAVCGDEVAADRIVEQQVVWLDGYHGTFYAPGMWNEPTLILQDGEHGKIKASTKYGDRIEVERRELLSA